MSHLSLYTIKLQKAICKSADFRQKMGFSCVNSERRAEKSGRSVEFGDLPERGGYETVIFC